jgi:two-component system chemotaxis response regulator CheB
MSTILSSQSPALPIRIVLVDDSALTLRLLQRGLAAFNDIAVVGTAADGEAALTLIQQTDPDVVCTDLHMPRLDGLGLVRRLMATQPKPIIVVSSALGEVAALARTLARALQATTCLS